MATRNITAFLPPTYSPGQDASGALQVAADAMLPGDALYIPAGLNLTYSKPINFAHRWNCRIFGDSGVPANWPYTPGISQTLSILTGPGWNCDGSIGNQFENLVLAGNSDQNSLTGAVAPSLLRFQDSQGWGLTRNQVRKCYFAHATDGVRNGESNQVHGDSLLIEDCGFQRCLRCLSIMTEQAVGCSMIRCSALGCPTILNLSAGSNTNVDGMQTTFCGDACPAIAARPVPTPANDFLFLLGQGGWNQLLTIKDLYIDGGQPAASQVLKSIGTIDGGYYVDIMGFAQAFTPSPNPMFDIQNVTLRITHSALKSGQIAGTSLGTLKDCPVITDTPWLTAALVKAGGIAIA